MKILVANRGEIAVRIIRACREMGIPSVAVYSDCDRDARHVREADQAVHIGPSPAAQSYLRSEGIIKAAKRTGADAVGTGLGLVGRSSTGSDGRDRDADGNAGAEVKAVIADKGYDSKEVVEAAQAMGAEAVIPTLSTRKEQRAGRAVQEAFEHFELPICLRVVSS